MKFNPNTLRLFTDGGVLIKRLQCSFRLDWRKLRPTDDPAARSCEICQHVVTDTAHHTEEYLLTLMQENSHACLKVDLSQPNLTLTLRNESNRPQKA